MTKRPICPVMTVGVFASDGSYLAECLGPDCAWWVKRPESHGTGWENDSGACGAMAKGEPLWWSPAGMSAPTRRMK